MLVTSDHGNAEEMLDEMGSPKTSHNCNRVPLALVAPAGLEAQQALDKKNESNENNEG